MSEDQKKNEKKPIQITETILRDAHQSLIATGKMIFLPEAPKMSEIKDDKRKPELCKNFSILFFCDVISRMMLLR